MAEQIQRQFFTIINMTKTQSSRVQRQLSPLRHRSNLYILGRRILPGRPVTFTVDEFEKNKAMFLQQVRDGKISIVGPDGTKVDSLSSGRLIITPPRGAPFLEGQEGEQPKSQENDDSGIPVGHGDENDITGVISSGVVAPAENQEGKSEDGPGDFPVPDAALVEDRKEAITQELPAIADLPAQPEMSVTGEPEVASPIPQDILDAVEAKAVDNVARPVVSSGKKRR